MLSTLRDRVYIPALFPRIPHSLLLSSNSLPSQRASLVDNLPSRGEDAIVALATDSWIEVKSPISFLFSFYSPCVGRPRGRWVLEAHMDASAQREALRLSCRRWGREFFLSAVVVCLIRSYILAKSINGANEAIQAIKQTMPYNP